MAKTASTAETLLESLGPTTALAPLTARDTVLERLEGFINDHGKLIKPAGLTAINTTRFDRRIVGIAEWRRA